MRAKFAIATVALTFISLLKLVSAYSWGYNFYSPSDLFQNEWVLFAGIFILFFAIVFVALSKTFKENKGAAIAIAIVVSLFISFAVSQTGWLYSYGGEELGSYLFIIAIALGVIFLLKVLISMLGGMGLFLSLFGVWLIFSKTEISYSLPYSIGNFDLFPIYEFLSSSSFLIGIIIALIAVLVIAYAGKEYDELSKGVRRWFWNKKKKSWKDLLENWN